MCFDRGPKDNQIKTVRPASFNCFIGGFSWLKIWWPNNQTRRWLRWYSSHFWSSRPYPNHKRIAIFRKFRSYFQSFPLCGEYFMWHFIYFAQFRRWESTSYKWSYGAPKKNLVTRSPLSVDPKKQTPLVFQSLTVPTTPPTRHPKDFHGSGAHLEGLWVWPGGFKSPRPNGWKWPRTRGRGRPRGGVDVGILLVWWSCHNSTYSMGRIHQ